MHPTKRQLTVAGLGLAAVLVVSSCGTDEGSSGSMDGMRHGTSATAAGSGSAAARQGDVMFAQMMIPHHEQAIEMADLALQSGSASAEVSELARQIKAAQGPEIRTMTRWLRDWNAPAGSSTDHGADGMMTDADMKELAAAGGAAFDRLWLTMMVEHHEGAVDLAQDVLKTTADPGVRTMARAIIDGQTKEIARMKGMVSANGSRRTSHHAGLPSAHVHAVGRDPGDGALLLATHEGLFRYGPAGPTKVGPTIDLMGFTVAAANHYYASGHPGAGTDLPQPVGLVESRDGGRSWEVLSRGGVSDFHALARVGATVVGFDGQVRRTRDGRSWTAASVPAPPRALAADPGGRQLLATTERGLLASTDQGGTWAAVKDAPLLLLVSWADAHTVVGVAPDGAVAISRDAAKTWRTTGRTEPAPQALSASMTPAGLEVLVVTERSVLASKDGASFTDATKRS